ncbi:hypothetical protein A2U01_0019360, partial [Trifolium medium]|nr:hypothetical protein [Trifolium medium]
LARREGQLSVVMLLEEIKGNDALGGFAKSMGVCNAFTSELCKLWASKRNGWLFVTQEDLLTIGYGLRGGNFA